MQKGPPRLATDVEQAFLSLLRAAQALARLTCGSSGARPSSQPAAPPAAAVRRSQYCGGGRKAMKRRLPGQVCDQGPASVPGGGAGRSTAW